MVKERGALSRGPVSTSYHNHVVVDGLDAGDNGQRWYVGNTTASFPLTHEGRAWGIRGMYVRSTGGVGRGRGICNNRCMLVYRPCPIRPLTEQAGRNHEARERSYARTFFELGTPSPLPAPDYV
jgi:hypothetical protein